MAFAPNGATLVSRGQDSTVRVWDVETGKCIEKSQPVEEFPWIWHSLRTADSSHPGDVGGIVQVWDLKTREEAILVGHTDEVRALAFSPRDPSAARLREPRPNDQSLGFDRKQANPYTARILGQRALLGFLSATAGY